MVIKCILIERFFDTEEFVSDIPEEVSILPFLSISNIINILVMSHESSSIAIVVLNQNVWPMNMN